MGRANGAKGQAGGVRVRFPGAQAGLLTDSPLRWLRAWSLRGQHGRRAPERYLPAVSVEALCLAASCEVRLGDMALQQTTLILCLWAEARASLPKSGSLRFLIGLRKGLETIA